MKALIEKGCPQTCGLCATNNCTDMDPLYCSTNYVKCDDANTKAFMAEYCKKTCRTCGQFSQIAFQNISELMNFSLNSIVNSIFLSRLIHLIQNYRANYGTIQIIVLITRITATKITAMFPLIKISSRHSARKHAENAKLSFHRFFFLFRLDQINSTILLLIF